MGLSQRCSCLCGLDNLRNVQRQTDFVSRNYISCCVQLCLLNVRYVKNKAMIVKDYVVDNDIDIMALAETWLRPGNTNDVEVGTLCPTGYWFLHVPRSHSRGGGVGVLFKDNLNINSSMCDTIQSFDSWMSVSEAFSVLGSWLFIVHPTTTPVCFSLKRSLDY